MTQEERNRALSRLGGELEGRDLACYADCGRDPNAPILGEGDPLARVCLFGRDPGRHEVAHGLPFVGAGGQKVRGGLHRALFKEAMGTFEDSIHAGTFVFWANMVPFKPLENKAWPPAVLRRFRPYIADLLLHGWRGSDVITLGEGAFKWFGLEDGGMRAALAEHWKRGDRFETSISLPFSSVDSLSGQRLERSLRIHPLPHPSPLNATWSARFPALLDARLLALGLDQAHWRLEVS